MCYACIRSCPVNAIRASEEETHAELMANRCIACGNCFVTCPHDAISYTDSIEPVSEMLKQDSTVVAILDPSISGEFEDVSDYRKFVSMLRKLGFGYVIEASFAADILAKKYEDLVKNFKGKYFIFSTCPIVGNFVEKYAPELIDNMTPLRNMAGVSDAIARKSFGENIKTVYIGSCLAYKAEIPADDTVDEVLTFSELRKMFATANITESKLEYSEFDGIAGNKGAYFAIQEGPAIAANLFNSPEKSLVYTDSGDALFRESIEDFKDNIEKINHHLNLFFCNGCINGPAISDRYRPLSRRTQVFSYAQKRIGQLDIVQWQKQLKEYESLGIEKAFEANDCRLPEVSEEKLREIYGFIGIDGEKAKGCHSCGFKNCKEFATAVAHGVASSGMCLSFNLSNKINYIKTLSQANERLSRMQKTMKESEDRAREEQQKAKEALERTHSMLQRLPSGVLLVDEKLKVILTNETLINILGEEAKNIHEIIPGLTGADLRSLVPAGLVNLISWVMQNDQTIEDKDLLIEDKLFSVSVFPINKNKIAGAIIKDLYLPEIQKDEIIRRVNEAIGENLSMVQQIAFLLGEGASKVEKMLNSIVNSYQQDNDTTGK